MQTSDDIAPAAPPTARRPRRVLLTLVILLAIAALLCLTANLAFRRGRQSTFTSTGPTITELEKLGHLCTLRVHVADVLQLNDQRWYGDIQGAWIVKGDALVAVDMRQAHIQTKDLQARRAVIVLPAPQLLSPRVDHEKTRTYDFYAGVLRSAATSRQLRDQAMLEAQKLITFAAQGEAKDASSVARRQAEDMIRSFYALVGWTVDVRWADQTAA
jgi:hypothetical protein